MCLYICYIETPTPPPNVFLSKGSPFRFFLGWVFFFPLKKNQGIRKLHCFERNHVMIS